MRTRNTKTRSDKNTLIRITFWMNTAIFFLSCYVIAKVPDGVGFAAFAFTGSLLWYLAYIKANYFEEERRPAAATTSLPDATKAPTTASILTPKEGQRNAL